MTIRHIPRKSKVKIEVFNGVGIADIVFGVIGLGLALLLLFANILEFPYSMYLTISFVVIWCMLYLNISEGVRLYYGLVLMFKFLSYKKKYLKNFKNPTEDISRIIPFEKISTDKYVQFYGGYYAKVVEILPMNFGLLTDEKQDSVVNSFAHAISRLNANQKFSIVKTRKPMVLDEMARYEDNKYNTLNDMRDRGLYNPDELDPRSIVFEERLEHINYLNTESKIVKDFYYIVIYDKDREALETAVSGMVSSLESSANPIFTREIKGNELLVFLKSTFTSEMDERELELISEQEKIKWAMPEKVEFGIKTTKIDGQELRSFVVTDYPLDVANAWLFPLFLLEESRVVINCEQIDKYQAKKMLDKSLMEVEAKLSKDMKTSKKIETQTHYDTLRELLQNLENNNQNLYNVNIHIMAAESVKKEVRSVLRQNGFRFSENFGRQIDGFVSSNISTLDLLKNNQRGIQTDAFASGFPFISNMLQDERGFYLGYNAYPVFVNFFARNSERVNSNMMVIGKSGAGKSYTTKTLLTNFAADNTRIFILDPENEYEILCKNLNGKIIDVGTSSDGIFNPFHIYATLEAEEGGQDDSYNAHLQFLEQFFKLILPGINADAFEKLNSIIATLYEKFNITPTTDISSISPDEFPIFDDLVELVDELIAKEKDEYHLRNLQTVRVYIEKFATGGRNSNLWNGPTSIRTNENFVCFSFRTLISNRNDVIANAQMLLVFKYLDNEIIKNRDFNLKYFAHEEKEEDHRRVVVAVDEAHVFINKKYPIALDFMAQMAKRIRKYNGMQIIITQNIKDFVGSEEIATQSTAIINACQYSLILSLSPNDINDLIALYRNAGGINDSEKDSIVSARRGQVFLITGPMNRTTIQIHALANTKVIFEQDMSRIEE